MVTSVVGDRLQDLHLAARARGDVIPIVETHACLIFDIDTLQAVVLGAKLRRLEDWNEQRRRAAALYSELLADEAQVVLPKVMPGNESVWHLYVIRVPERDRVLAALHEGGVGAGIHYPIP